MTLSLYDEAMNEKLTAMFSNYIMAPPDEAFTRETEDGKVDLPLISAYRISNPINFEEYNGYEVFAGRVTRRNMTSPDLIRQQGLPVTITYQIDIWATKRTEADGLYREVVFYLMTHPNISVIIPGIEQPFHFSMKLTDTDSPTEYGSFGDNGEIHRYTLTYEIASARMFFQSKNLDLVHDVNVAMDSAESWEDING